MLTSYLAELIDQVKKKKNKRSFRPSAFISARTSVSSLFAAANNSQQERDKDFLLKILHILGCSTLRMKKTLSTHTLDIQGAERNGSYSASLATEQHLCKNVVHRINVIVTMVF